jgi:hypothetical protein
MVRDPRTTIFTANAGRPFEQGSGAEQSTHAWLRSCPVKTFKRALNAI